MGEVRPTLRKQDPKARDWRTREDLLQSVWTDILHWLHSDPDGTAKSLLERLMEKHPRQFEEMPLAYTPAGVREGRYAMARKLVFAGTEEDYEIEAIPAATGINRRAVEMAS